jgi:hypothetical protein
MLIDLDAVGGGLDVLLGIEDQPGARWPDLQLAGGELDPDRLRQRLPRADGVDVLSTRAGEAIVADPGVVIRAARQSSPVVLDVPRWLPPAAAVALPAADAVVVLVPGEVRAVAACTAFLADLPLPGGVRRILAYRPGPIDAGTVARALGLADEVELPRDDWLAGDRTGALRLDGIPASLDRTMRRLWALADDSPWPARHASPGRAHRR